MGLILHITTRSRWEQARAAGSYRGDTLETQGFIHGSRPHQVVAVAEALFRGRTDLVLLCIDGAKVRAEIQEENLEGGQERYPHIYGPLNLDAVLEVLDFPPRPDGSFDLPEAVGKWLS